MLDTTKHWFYFGSELPDNAPEGTLLIKVPENGAVQGEMKVANEPFYELPETGGPGTILYTISGIILMGGALMYCIYQWRRRGRGIE